MSALYILKKNALLRGRTASGAEEDSRRDLRLIVVTTAVLAFTLGIYAGWWLVDQYRSPVKTMQMAGDIRK